MAAQRGCDFAAGTEESPATIGGLSNEYAMIPITKTTGMTIGGTRYFIGFRGDCCTAGGGSQETGQHCHPKRKAGEQDYRLKISPLALRIGLLPTRRGRPLFRQKLNQLPADSPIV
jgi:hypothetical protein